MTQLWSEKSFLMEFTIHGQVIWTDREDQRLMNSYGKITMEKTMKLFPGRTLIAIQTRASRLRIPRKGRHYTSDEDSLLLKLRNETDLTYKQMTSFFKERDWPSLRMRIYRIRNRDRESDS